MKLFDRLFTRQTASLITEFFKTLYVKIDSGVMTVGKAQRLPFSQRDVVFSGLLPSRRGLRHLRNALRKVAQLVDPRLQARVLRELLDGLLENAVSNVEAGFRVCAPNNILHASILLSERSIMCLLFCQSASLLGRLFAVQFLLNFAQQKRPSHVMAIQFEDLEHLFLCFGEFIPLEKRAGVMEMLADHLLPDLVSYTSQICGELFHVRVTLIALFGQRAQKARLQFRWIHGEKFAERRWWLVDDFEESRCSIRRFKRKGIRK